MSGDASRKPAARQETAQVRRGCRGRRRHTAVGASSSVSRKPGMWVAPRALKAPTFWKFSPFEEEMSGPAHHVALVTGVPIDFVFDRAL